MIRKYPQGPLANPDAPEYVMPRSLMMFGWLSDARNSASRARSLWFYKTNENELAV